MLGWINDGLEKYIIEKHGANVWRQIKSQAGCNVKDGGFIKLEKYKDISTIALVDAASTILGLSQRQVYKRMGEYFVFYFIKEGHENLLFSQGRTLMEWMNNINAVHQHLQDTFPKKMTPPEFWCEENQDGTLTLFYYSTRGTYLAPFTVGFITEVARLQFELDIRMKQVTTQGKDGARMTSWIVSTRDPEDLPRLQNTEEMLQEFDIPKNVSCPFTGNGDAKPNNEVPTMVVTGDILTETTEETSGERGRPAPERRGLPSRSKSFSSQASFNSSLSNRSGLSNQTGSLWSEEDENRQRGSLSSAITKKLFPYHLVINRDFAITQVGNDLPKAVGSTENVLLSYEIDEVLEFVKPKNAKWTQRWARKLKDQEYVVKCTLPSSTEDFMLKGTLMSISPSEILLILCPEANSLDQLRDMNLTMSDLPAHGGYRDTVFLREHLSHQINNALRMEKLSKTLQTEKELLESLIPEHAAERLRQGQTVKPRLHNNVTMFFSDIVGFTSLCKKMAPCTIIDLLNHLYGMMDYLAGKFNIFKIETIGDAYVCCSGLPEADGDHAMNVANFAVAVAHCVQSILSPVDGSRLQLRIGINTGSCASGIVGTTNPRYCVFGDTVNTTARHESTGKAGRVHCSLTTMIQLHSKAEMFNLISRENMVEMKGKGMVPTYWLEATEANPLANKAALKKLDEELDEVLGCFELDEEEAPKVPSEVVPKSSSKAPPTGETDEGYSTGDDSFSIPLKQHNAVKGDAGSTLSSSASSVGSQNTGQSRDLTNMVVRYIGESADEASNQGA